MRLIALSADMASVTAIANDYGFESFFPRQVEGLMMSDDVLLGLFTSGNSENIGMAFLKAREKQGKTILLSGRDGGKLKRLADIAITVPENNTARIQEYHECIYHILCELVESPHHARNV